VQIKSVSQSVNVNKETDEPPIVVIVELITTNTCYMSKIRNYLSHCYTIAWDRLSNQFFIITKQTKYKQVNGGFLGKMLTT